MERALGYTRGALVTITPAHLGLPTPCAAWRLVDLLAHMEDSLDAFAEGTTGTIGLYGADPSPVGDRVGALQSKACHLLGAWAGTTTPRVSVAGLELPVDTVARLAALEIAVHGWDVARTTSYDEPVPHALAEALLPTALTVALERTEEFASPVPVSADATPATRLLALLGRR